MLCDMTLREQEIIRNLLLQELEALGPEIHHTDNRGFRDDLREKRDAIRKLLQHVDSLQPTA